MLISTTSKKDMGNIAHEHVEIKLQNLGLKGAINLFGQIKVEKNTENLFTKNYLIDGRENMRIKTQNICGLRNTKVLIIYASIVGLVRKVRLMIGQMLTTSIQEILTTILDSVVPAIENMTYRKITTHA